MVECLIFGSLSEMKTTLERLLVDFPEATLHRAGTVDSPYQVGVDLGAIDEPTFFGWAVDTSSLSFCFSLVMKSLDEPKPEWMRRALARIAIEEIRQQQAPKQLPG